jgi:hypothetical protein
MRYVPCFFMKAKKLIATKLENDFFNYFSRLSTKQRKPESVVLVQCVEDLYYYGLFGQICSSLQASHSISVEQYVVRCLNVAESSSIFSFFKARFIINPLLSYKWRHLFSSFCDKVAFSGASIMPINDVIDFFSAIRLWKNINSKDSLINLKIDDVLVGDLINDSYLRYKPSPVIDLDDFYILILLWQALRYVRRSKSYFTISRPALFLTSYCTYIHHGIPVRVALQNGVRVFSFGNYQEFAKQVSLNDWVHTKNPDKYAEKFGMLNNREEKLAAANLALSARLSGGIDAAFSYMRKSAYEETGEVVPNVKGATIIFLHDFYDSPNVYRDMVFPDFWEWICFTIETLIRADIQFFLKSHPNQITLSDHVLSDLKNLYPNLLLISPSVTNKQLVEAGMVCAVTVYGTVAHEMAYLGIPSIGCARHPHINFEFCRTATTRDEYAELLRSSSFCKIDKVSMRKQSLIFYYMHNLNLSPDMLSLREELAKFRAACACANDKKDLVSMLQQMSMLDGYKKQIMEMLR